MHLGYNTNGFADHQLGDALTILGEIGYRSVAITLERGQLDPPDRTGVARCVKLLKPLIESSGLKLTIETGARFILDPRRKHQPTLVSAGPVDRRGRIEFLKAAIEVAAATSADSVSLWSGGADDDAGEAELLARLTDSLGEVLQHAEARGVRLAFEPEPGMFIDTMARFRELHEAIDHPLLGLTLDVGHVHCLGDGLVSEHVDRWGDLLWNVHLADMLPGRHEHLMFGEGDMDFVAIFGTFGKIDYRGPIHVELPRHCHDAVEVAKRSYQFLKSYMGRGGG